MAIQSYNLAGIATQAGQLVSPSSDGFLEWQQLHQYGGSGEDTFVFRAGDTVLDFTQGEDRIDVSHLGISDFSDFGSLAFSRHHNPVDGIQDTDITVLYGGAQHTLTLEDFSGTLTADDFVFIA